MPGVEGTSLYPADERDGGAPKADGSLCLDPLPTKSLRLSFQGLGLPPLRISLDSSSPFHLEHS